MKNYYYKLILTFFIISTILTLSIGVIFINLLQNTNINIDIIKYTVVIAIGVIAITCIVMSIMTNNKIIKPMSRMLKSANSSRNKENINIENENVEEAITELQRKLINANRQKVQTDSILKHLTDGVISFDKDGNVTYINPAAINLLNLKQEDNTFEKIFNNYDDINMERIIYLEDFTSSETKIENEQGTMVLFFVPFKDELNRPTGLMVVIQDITEHVKLNNMRKEFVADVSHELKTPITSIKGFSETLLDGVDDKETERHFLKIINDNADRMENLVQDLLTLSKYDKKIEKNNIMEFDLGELTKQCAEKFEIEVKKKNQELNCFVTANVPKVLADRDGIERVITNIISNSVKYTQEGGKIDVYVGFVHSDAYVKIKDNGIGIPESDLSRIFERFYRVDKARSRMSGGTGLGLSIAKEIVEQNKGSIDIRSEEGKGTEVVIKIPIKNNK